MIKNFLFKHLKIKRLYHLLIFIVILTASCQNNTSKEKVYFCKHLKKLTYFNIKPPSQSWGQCYFTLMFTKGQYAEQKSKLTINSRIYRNFHIQHKLVDAYDSIPLKE